MPCINPRKYAACYLRGYANGRQTLATQPLVRPTYHRLPRSLEHQRVKNLWKVFINQEGLAYAHQTIRLIFLLIMQFVLQVRRADL
jgi:hypothetical protein